MRPGRDTKLHFHEMPYLFVGNNAGILTTNLIFYLKVSSSLSLPKFQHHQRAEIAKAPEPSGSLLKRHGQVECCAGLVQP